MNDVQDGPFREEAVARFRDPINWKEDALELRRQGLPIVEIARRIGIP